MFDPAATFGRIDIYVFDQILKGRIGPDQKILDAGCGTGRNLTYLLRAGADVYGVDRDPVAIERLRAEVSGLSVDLDTRFGVADLTALPFSDGYFDVVICSAVLHFAEDESQFDVMMGEMWRVLRTGGLFFARLASTIGIRDRIERVGPPGPRGGARYLLPDGTERFCVDLAFLLETTSALDGELLEPIKTTNVQNRRCMTTWVMRKV